MDRKLAAILAADVVGYSALMERDEQGTFERLKALRRTMFEPLVKEHHGRIFKMMGDGFLVEFASVVDAVACAAALQSGLHGHNEQVPEEERIILRIGVNLGDVIIEGKDRHGEGVNIAARLEQLAEPGGVCVSQPVIDQLSNKLPLVFDDIGEHRVKNIEKPVHAYRAKLEGVPVKRRLFPTARSGLPAIAAVVAVLAVMAGGAAFWFNKATPSLETAPALGPLATDTRPSLVVLPLANLSDDKEQGYLADGITEDLTTELARIPGLFVVSRNAAFTYKDKNVSPPQIAKELGVRYILEGSTRRAGDDMQLNAQLIDAETGGHVWAERFDGEWVDVFALQDKVVSSIAGALKLRLITGQGMADIAGGTSIPAAYDAYLRGLELYLRINNTPEEFAKAASYFRQALELDPDFGAAAAQLAWIYWDADDGRVKAMGVTWDEVDADLPKFLAEAAKHPSVPYYQLTADLLVRERKSDEAIALLHKAVALDPSDPLTYAGLSQALIFNGRPKDGLEYLDAAMRVDPVWTDWRRYLAGLAAFGEGRYDDAAAAIEKIDLKSNDPWSKLLGLHVLISAYAHLGRSAEMPSATAAFRTVLMEGGHADYSRLRVQRFFVYKNDADINRLLEGLAKAGLPELPATADLPAKDRLSEAEIKSVFFGHEVSGRRTVPDNVDYKAITSLDGATTVSFGSTTVQGTRWTQAGAVCVAYPRDLTNCGAVFRNPSGTFEEKNEFLYVGPTARLAFSVMK